VLSEEKLISRGAISQTCTFQLSALTKKYLTAQSPRAGRLLPVKQAIKSKHDAINEAQCAGAFFFSHTEAILSLSRSLSAARESQSVRGNGPWQWTEM